MLIYIKCINCSRIFYEMDKYFADLDNIFIDKKLSKEEKEEQSAALLDKYDIRLYCCRAIVLGTIQAHKIIN